MKNMRTCILINSLEGGGAERVVQLLSNYWAERGHEIVIVTLDQPNTAYEFSRDVKIISLIKSQQKFKFIKYFLLPYQAYLWRRFLNQNRFDYTLSLLFRANFVNILASKFRKKRPVIISERSMANVLYSKSRYLNILMKNLISLTYNKADCIIAISTGVKEKLAKCGVFQEKIVIIHNPVALSDERQPRTYKNIQDMKIVTLVTMGRLINVKRHETIIRTLSLMNKRSNMRLIIIGDGPNDLALKGLAIELGLEGAITFTGWLKEPGVVLSKADIYVHAARYEAFGNAIIEAMSYGLPIVCTQSHGGIRDILGENKYGLLSDSDTAEGLAELLKLVIDDNELYNELSQKSLDRSRDFSLPLVSQKYLDVFESQALIEVGKQ